MCQHLTLLAQSGERRLVARCEHGTLHLIWSYATIVLLERDFQQLSALIEQWATGRATNISQGNIRLYLVSADIAELWIADIGLALRQQDLIELADLLGSALLTLNNAQPVETLGPLAQTRLYQPSDGYAVMPMTRN